MMDRKKVVHNCSVLAAERGSNWSLHTGSFPKGRVKSLRSLKGVLEINTYHGNCNNFFEHTRMPNLKEMGCKGDPFPDKPVYKVLYDAYHPITHKIINFQPETWDCITPTIRPDIIYVCWWHLANICDTVKTKVKPMFFMNALSMDPLESMSKEQLLDFIANQEPKHAWYSAVKVPRGHKYMAHIVLDGELDYHVPGFTFIKLQAGDCVITPVKYWVKLISVNRADSTLLSIML